MRVGRFLLPFSLVASLLTPPAAPQTATSPQAVQYLQRALAALIASTPLSDVTLSGSARYIAGRRVAKRFAEILVTEIEGGVWDRGFDESLETEIVARKSCRVPHPLLFKGAGFDFSVSANSRGSFLRPAC
jgi:hypothetical protein